MNLPLVPCSPRALSPVPPFIMKVRIHLPTEPSTYFRSAKKNDVVNLAASDRDQSCLPFIACMQMLNQLASELAVVKSAPQPAPGKVCAHRFLDTWWSTMGAGAVKLPQAS